MHCHAAPFFSALLHKISGSKMYIKGSIFLLIIRTEGGNNYEL